MGFSPGSAEPQAEALQALIRLKEENNTSCCTGAWERPCPSMGCPPAGTGSASTSASLSPRVMTQGWSPRGTRCWETRVHIQRQRRAHPDSSPLGGHLTAHPLVCRALLCLPTAISAQRPAAGTNAMGATECSRSPTTVPLQESAAPGSTEAASLAVVCLPGPPAQQPC